jgi:5-methylcytosine-specific restriction endonuclease McrA
MTQIKIPAAYDVIIRQQNIKVAPAMLAHPGAWSKLLRSFDVSILSHKKCVKCGEVKPLPEFYKDKKSPDGHFYSCKTCELSRSHNWWEEHKNDSDRPRRLEVKKKYYRNNKSILDEKNKQWAKDHPEARKAILRRSYLKDISKYLARTIGWRKKNPEAAAAIWRNRRARIEGDGGKITTREWVELKKKYDYTCLCCKRCEPEIKLTLDHVKPLVMGGAHSIKNAQPLCLSCNCSKHDKWIDYR